MNTLSKPISSKLGGVERLIAFTLAVLTFCVAGSAAAADEVAVGHFSTATSLQAAGWKPMRLRGHDQDTAYTLVNDNGVRVVQAVADGTMSGMSYAINIDPAQYPVLSFRFKVDQLPTGADLKTRKGDDFAARIYVLFDYDISKLPFVERSKIQIARSLYGDSVPSAALNYVWDAKYPTGTIAWNAYTQRVRMLVVESGDAKLGQWVTITRNVAEDFTAAFGEPPPRIVGVVIATDADNTRSKARAHYGDITFKAQ